MSSTGTSIGQHRNSESRRKSKPVAVAREETAGGTAQDTIEWGGGEVAEQQPKRESSPEEPMEIEATPAATSPSKGKIADEKLDAEKGLHHHELNGTVGLELSRSV